MRYVNLSTIMVFRLVSHKVMDRLPDYHSMIKYKILFANEAEKLQTIEEKSPHEATWAPIAWALQLITKSRKEGKITLEAPVYSNLVSAFEYVEAANRKILNYGWINFPLAYTQVATLSVYSYMFMALFSGQYLKPQDPETDTETFPNIGISFSRVAPFSSHTPDLYVPVVTILEFVSYMGWIKVAEGLLNPFGDDDDDFQINYLIDRNISVSYLIAAGDDNFHDIHLTEDIGGSVPQLPLSQETIDLTRADEEQEKAGGGVGSKVMRKVSSILGPRPGHLRMLSRQSSRSERSRKGSVISNADTAAMDNEVMDIIREGSKTDIKFDIGPEDDDVDGNPVDLESGRRSPTTELAPPEPTLSARTSFNSTLGNDGMEIIQEATEEELRREIVTEEGPSRKLGVSKSSEVSLDSTRGTNF